MNELEPPADPSSHETVLDSLVVECLARVERSGGTAPETVVDEICSERPEYAAALRSRIRALREAGLLGTLARQESFPERLGDFRLLRRLGGGGMGVVYLAEQCSLSRRVALKLIRPEQLYFPGARARFDREAHAIARLAHPSIVPVYMVGEESGIPFIAMELVSGATLAAILVRLTGRDPARLTGADLLTALCDAAEVDRSASDATAMPFSLGWVDACVWIAREVAQALEHAHQRGIVHRDIKTSNILLTPEGRVLLVDFGLASSAGADALTRSGSALGSLPYMSPEQVRGGSTDVGPAVDVYGLGVTLYELLALRLPFATGDSQVLRAAILEARPRPLRALHARVPRDLAAVVSVAMAPEAAQRYASAASFAQDLTRVLQREPVEARPAGATRQLARWTQRHPAAAALAVCVGFVGPSLVALQQWRSNVSIAAERDRADENLGEALDAVDTMLTRVGDSKLAFVPQAEEVRRELLEDALAFYQRFLESSGSSADVRLRNAVTHRKAAKIQRDLGRRIESEVTVARAETELRELAALDRDDVEVEQALMNAMQDRALVLRDLGRSQEAEALNRELLERADATAVADPARARAREWIAADTCVQLAYQLRVTNRAQEGIDFAERAVELLRRIEQREPDDPDVRRKLGNALASSAQTAAGVWEPRCVDERFAESIELLRSAAAAVPEDPTYRENLGFALGAAGRFLSQAHFENGFAPAGPTAQQALIEGVAVYSALGSDFPRVVRYQEALAGQCNNLCIDFARSGRADEARAYAERAIACYEALIELEPAVPQHHIALGSALSNLAKLRTKANAAAEALPLLERAAAEQQLAIASEPDNASFRDTYVSHLCAQFETLLKLGLWRRATEVTRAISQAKRADPENAVRAAEDLLKCSKKAALDPELDDGARERAQRELDDEALDWLRRWLDSGHTPSQLANRAGLKSLNDHPDFRALLDRAR